MEVTKVKDWLAANRRQFETIYHFKKNVTVIGALRIKDKKRFHIGDLILTPLGSGTLNIIDKDEIHVYVFHLGANIKIEINKIIKLTIENIIDNAGKSLDLGENK